MFKKLKELFMGFECAHLDREVISRVQLVKTNGGRAIVTQYKCNKCGKVFSETK